MVTAGSEYILAFDVMRLAEAAFSVDKLHHITAWNTAAEHLFGCPATGLLGLRCHDVMAALHLRPCAYCVAHEVSSRADGGGGMAPVEAHQLAAPVITLEKGIVLSAFAARSLAGETRTVHLIQLLPSTLHGSGSGAGSSAQAEKAQAPEASAGDGKASAFTFAPQVTVRLTQREREILEMLARGRDTGEIADTLSISRVTARNHIAHVIAKLGASTRLQAVIVAARVGLL